MNRLEQIKEFTQKLSKAARWHSTQEAIMAVETHQSDRKKHEYIYEFYCLMRILDDLRDRYSVQIMNNHLNNRFPKAPAKKANFPYFSVGLKSDKEMFQICAGTSIDGVAGEPNAPDISIQKRGAGLAPDYRDVAIIFDAKFRADSSAGVSDTDFSKMVYMIQNLKCQEGENTVPLRFKKLKGLEGNCLITNGRAFKADNPRHHRVFHVKEVEHFDTNSGHRIIG